MAEDGIDLVKEVLNEVQLSQFFLPIRDDLQITKLEHFEFVKPEDFDPVGLSRPGTVYGLIISLKYNKNNEFQVGDDY